MSELAFSAPSERNKQPILEQLLALLPPQGRALEVASGTGQHVVWFAQHLPGWQWQPTDQTDEYFESIHARIAGAGLANVAPPHPLDVLHEPWAAVDEALDLIYCANMLHIAPWACCAALMRGAARHLAPGGRLVTYGPYLEDEVPTAESNLAFDASLRRRNPQWGLRRLQDVEAVARAAGLALAARHAMPTNNLLLVWARTASEPRHTS
jgi:SAM-dependent methyltransferase